jgi:hypothetical protein
MVPAGEGACRSVTTRSCSAFALELTFEMIEIAFRHNVAPEKLLFGSKWPVLHNLVGYHGT